LASTTVLPSVEIWRKFYFCGCKSLSLITFESDSHFQYIKESSFSKSGLTILGRAKDSQPLLSDHVIKT
jgi:hypothetical protein